MHDFEDEFPTPDAESVARVFLAGAFSPESCTARLTVVFGRVHHRRIERLVRLVFAVFPPHSAVPTLRRLTLFLLRFESYFPDQFRISPPRDLTGHRTIPAEAITGSLPILNNIRELAEFLDLTPERMLWLADPHGFETKRPRERQRHYRYRWVERTGRTPRPLEIPKQRLKAIQKKILAEILNKLRPHPAACAFRKGQSVRDFAKPHVGRRVVIRFDIANFFPSILQPRVQATFRAVGYVEEVAFLLSALTTNRLPTDQLHAEATGSGARHLRQHLLSAHLPQGAPTSPALANLCAFHLDRRLTGLAARFSLSYTRYADDLLFSGNLSDAEIYRFRIRALAILIDEGFEARSSKSAVLRKGSRQQACGVILNTRLNIAREDYDALKATLHNCIRHGPELQNHEGVADFRSVLRGRIAWVHSLNVAKGEKLLAMFEQIHWNTS
ncbi:reverse transcriptase family protein [Stratiformator vulcanicus]|uniref:RNA-directed DNA polymerase n=1 Tax=Stratiformator vulcanicus TaxID=2527980 RepID=A0A517QZS4_9PLAN|nr:reverse transcriptase family protein [Stratiformator vulcanicus]QDT37131.1 Reverse transcriptase (RNA-dependent DNA polymerase) [Stratiformator vulcanicus]